MDNQQRSIEDRLHWLGGIIDGEGCITAGAGHTKTGHGYIYKHRRYVPAIDIVNTDPIIINEIMSILDEVKLPYWANWRKSKAHPEWKLKCDIMITGMKRCNKAAKKLVKYIIAKRDRALAMIEWTDKRLAMGQREAYTQEDYDLINLIRASPIPLRDYTPTSTDNVDDDIVHTTTNLVE